MKGRINIGELKQRVTVLNENNTPDGRGGYTPGTSEDATTWAKITPLKGSRAVEVGAIVNGKPYLVKLVYRTDVTIDETTKIVYGSKTLVVHSVIDIDEANYFYELIAIERG